MGHDMAKAAADGVAEEEYLEGLAEYLASLECDTTPVAVAHYLAESWTLEEGKLVSRPWVEGEPKDEHGLTPSYKHAVAAFVLLVKPAPEQAATPAQQAADEVKAAAEKAVEQAEVDEQAARKEAHGTLAALVRAYAKGERAYRDGLLESGRLCQVYIAKRLLLGDKRAAAVQAIEGQLAAYASDTVDVNRLVRCYAAYSLLAEGQGLDKDAKAVPMGCYRDAWALLVERADANTASEHYVLLPGLEGECKQAFKDAVANGLSKAACIDQCKVLQHKQLALAAEAHPGGGGQGGGGEGGGGQAGRGGPGRHPGSGGGGPEGQGRRPAGGGRRGGGPEGGGRQHRRRGGPAGGGPGPEAGR